VNLTRIHVVHYPVSYKSCPPMDPDFDPDYDTVNDFVKQQLRATISQDLSRTLQSGRPLLTHLNADTTWLLSLPIPGHTGRENGRRDIKSKKDKDDGKESAALRNGRKSEKRYFHILIDPWLRGSQSDVAQFFSQQWHANERRSCFQEMH